MTRMVTAMSETCDRCNRETDVEEKFGGEYCIVCLDAFDDPDAEATPGGED